MTLTRATLQPGDFVKLDHDHNQALVQAFRAAGAQYGTVVIAPKHHYLVWGIHTHDLFASDHRPATDYRELTLRQILGPLEGDYIHKDDIPDKATYNALLALAKGQHSFMGGFEPPAGDSVITYRKDTWFWSFPENQKAKTRCHPSDFLIEDKAPAPSSPFPPPGTECETTWANGWYAGFMVGLDRRGRAVIEVNNEHGIHFATRDPNEVRLPVDKRQRAIDYAIKTTGNGFTDAFGKLYDAGLLKDPEE